MEMKNNEVGDLYTVNLNKTKVLNIFTKAGNYRRGKIYSLDKFFTILSGKTEVTTRVGEKDIKTTYSAGEIIKIPARTPNIFYYPEDTEMLEWFSKDVHIEKFEEYYNLKK